MNERIIWNYWFLTVICIAIGIFAWPQAIFLAMVLTMIHTIHFLFRQPGLIEFPIQVRIGYLGLLALGQVPVLDWIYWILLIGGTVKLTTGYCPLARMVSLLPWNRSQPMNLNLLKKVIFTPTIPGSAIQLVLSK